MIRLPEGVAFVDYASVALSRDHERIAVVSQVSSALWIGTLASDGFEVVDGGTVYDFPRDDAGRILYGTVEGITWAGERLVAVSDRVTAARANHPPAPRSSRCTSSPSPEGALSH